MNFLNTLKENKGLILILILAAILRFYQLDFQSLWMDEIYTMNVSNPANSFSTLIEDVNVKEGFPYLYFILIKILLSIFGYIGIVARFLSVFFGILSVYLIYKLGKEIFDKNTGLIAAILLTFNEFAICYSQEARPYAFYLMGILLVVYRLVIFLKNPNSKNAVYYGISAGLLLNISFFGFINLFSQAFVIIYFFCYQEKNEKFNYAKNVILSGIIAIVMFVPNIAILKKLLTFESGWIPAPTETTISLIFKELLGNSELTIYFFIGFLFFYFFKVFNEKETSFKKGEIYNKLVFSFILFFSWFFIYLFIFVIKSYTDTSILISRYFINLLPIFFLICAYSINLINNRIVKNSILFVLLLLMWINQCSIKKYYSTPTKTQYREATNFVIEKNVENQQVYTNQYYWFGYYFNLKQNKFNLAEKPTLEILINEMIQNPTMKKSFWYVNATVAPEKLSGVSQKYLDENFKIQNKMDFYYSASYQYVCLEKNPLKTSTTIKTSQKVSSTIVGLKLSNITDNNWAGGVGISINRFLIDYSINNEDILKSGSEIIFNNGKSIKINNYQVNGNFIQIEIDGKVNEYMDIAKYPNTINIK